MTMAKKENAAAAGLFGLGIGMVLGAMASGASERRIASSRRIRERLGQAGIKLVTAELGRTPTGPAWVVTVESPEHRIKTMNAQLGADQDPHSDATCEEVADRVIASLRSKAG